MAHSPLARTDDAGKVRLTLTRAEIAFLNATIALLQEEQTGRKETVTLGISSATNVAAAFMLVAHQVMRVFTHITNWNDATVVTADYIIGGTVDLAQITPEQAAEFANLRSAAREGVSLDALIRLRAVIQASVVSASQDEGSRDIAPGSTTP